MKVKVTPKDQDNGLTTLAIELIDLDDATYENIVIPFLQKLLSRNEKRSDVR
jgi:hypothetical protein